jgi:hypothetical protein
MLATVYRQQGNSEGGISALSNVLHKLQDASQAKCDVLRERGELFSRLHKPEKAIEDLINSVAVARFTPVNWLALSINKYFVCHSL